MPARPSFLSIPVLERIPRPVVSIRTIAGPIARTRFPISSIGAGLLLFVFRGYHGVGRKMNGLPLQSAGDAAVQSIQVGEVPDLSLIINFRSKISDVNRDLTRELYFVGGACSYQRPDFFR